MKVHTIKLKIVIGLLLACGSVGAMEESLEDQLFGAIAEGNTEEMKALITSGVNLNCQDEHGSTPLHRAISWRKQPEIAKILIRKDADLNIQNTYGETPLHEAAWLGATDTVKALLIAGADPEVKNRRNKTPLEYARDDATKIIFLSHTKSEEVQHIIPFLIALKRHGKLPKDIHKLIANYMVQGIVSDKLKKAKKYLPDYDENELRQTIEDGVIEVLKRKTKPKEPAATKKSWWHYLWPEWLE